MTSPIVRIRGGAFAYPRAPASTLANVSFDILPGDRIAVTGPSGAGKSTLLNVLGLLERFSSGRHELRGVRVDLASPRKLSDLRAAAIGFMFQSFHLLPELTAAENVLMGTRYGNAARKARQTEAIELLERVGLSGESQRRPLELSGGQQQRVALARALASRPALLLCDEPTGNLDAQNAAMVLDVIDQQVPQESALVIVTHDDGVAKRMRQRVAVVGGEVRWEGRV